MQTIGSPLTDRRSAYHAMGPNVFHHHIYPRSVWIAIERSISGRRRIFTRRQRKASVDYGTYLALGANHASTFYDTILISIYRHPGIQTSHNRANFGRASHFQLHQLYGELLLHSFYCPSYIMWRSLGFASATTLYASVAPVQDLHETSRFEKTAYILSAVCIFTLNVYIYFRVIQLKNISSDCYWCKVEWFAISVFMFGVVLGSVRRAHFLNHYLVLGC